MRHPLGKILRQTGNTAAAPDALSLIKTIDIELREEFEIVMEEAFSVGVKRGLLALKIWPCIKCFPDETRVNNFLYLTRRIS